MPLTLLTIRFHLIRLRPFPIPSPPTKFPPLPPSFASSQYFAPFLHHSQVRVALLIAFKFDLTLRISKYPHPQVNHPQVRLTLPLNRVSKTFCTNIWVQKQHFQVSWKSEIWIITQQLVLLHSSMGRHSLFQLLFPLEGIKVGPHNQILQEFYRPNLERWKLLIVECFSHAWLPLLVIVVQNKLPLCQIVIPIDDWVRRIRIVRQNEEKLMPLDQGKSQNHGK